MKGRPMRKGASKDLAGTAGELSPEASVRLQAVADMPEESIKLDDPDAPEIRDWTGAVRGRFYRPTKQLKSLRVDSDVLAWFQAQGPGYQTRINRVLRASMLRGLRARQTESQE